MSCSSSHSSGEQWDSALLKETNEIHIAAFLGKYSSPPTAEFLYNSVYVSSDTIMGRVWRWSVGSSCSYWIAWRVQRHACNSGTTHNTYDATGPIIAKPLAKLAVGRNRRLEHHLLSLIVRNSTICSSCR